MRKKLLISSAIFVLGGCTASDIQSLTTAALSNDPSAAFKTIARSKAVTYASNPQKLAKDLTYLKDLIESITSVWGEKNVKVPQKTEYVKYLQNYKSRAMIDFDSGVVTVETLDEKDTKQSLKNAIVTTLLLPDDPRAVDLFGTKPVKLGGTPYLLGEVKDDQNKDIRYAWRAERFADILVKNEFKQKTITNKGSKMKVSYVTIPMVKDHAGIRVAKFKPYVQKFASTYNLSENLVYAIIRTESNFNQYAVSGAGAIGLMQIVPTSAGKDAYKQIKGKSWTPSRDYLFNAKNNIELGSAYIQILKERYLAGINNGISKEYCVISAYNTGSGNVLKTFDPNRSKAFKAINSKNPSDVYYTLINKLPYHETRRYLKKVVEYKKDFVNL